MNVLGFELDDGAANGTSLQGTFTATYDELVKVFGEPNYKAERDGGFDKVWTQWEIEFKVQDEDDPEDFDYVVATIYDWKESSPLNSRDGTAYRWHVGGKDWRAEDAVGTVFNKGVSNA